MKEFPDRLVLLVFVWEMPAHSRSVGAFELQGGGCFLGPGEESQTSLSIPDAAPRLCTMLSESLCSTDELQAGVRPSPDQQT